MTSLRGEGWLQGAVRDDVWRCKIIRAKRGVCKVTGLVFRCHKKENNLKNIFYHLSRSKSSFFGQIWLFGQADPIKSVKIIVFDPQNGWKYFRYYFQSLADIPFVHKKTSGPMRTHIIHKKLSTVLNFLFKLLMELRNCKKWKYCFLLFTL